MFYQQLQKACKNANTTVTATLKAIGIGTANGTYWKNGSMPSSENVIQLAEFLGVSTDFLLKGSNTNHSTDISEDEKELLNYYKELDDYGKGRVIGKAEELAEAARRQKALAAKPVKKAKPKVIRLHDPEPLDESEDENEYIDIPLPDIPASAGTGMYLDSDYAEIIRVLATDEAIKADYAIRVSGDSMEPRYYNGDILAVSEQTTVDPGEVGVFVYNGERYVKQFGGNRLISINPDYQDIFIEDTDSFFCQGKVISVLQIAKK